MNESAFSRTNDFVIKFASVSPPLQKEQVWSFDKIHSGSVFHVVVVTSS